MGYAMQTSVYTTVQPTLPLATCADQQSRPLANHTKQRRPWNFSEHSKRLHLCGAALSRSYCRLHVLAKHRCATAQAQPALGIDGVHPLTAEQIQSYRNQGFLRLKGVFTAETLAHYGAAIDAEVLAADKTPLEDDEAYQQAFTQVTNLWERNATIREFVLGHRLGRIAAELLQVDGVRIYHDQALYKESGGGITPWHCDQFYWPLASDKILTAWIPLQPVPLSMGPLAFAVGSHRQDLGRSLGIGVASQRKIARRVAAAGCHVYEEAFELGEVSFHAGWTFHRAGPNSADVARQVMTIIFFDEDMLVTDPMNDNQRADLARWLPGICPGQPATSRLNPVVWSKHSRSL